MVSYYMKSDIEFLTESQLQLYTEMYYGKKKEFETCEALIGSIRKRLVGTKTYQYINDFIYQYEEANSTTLSQLLDARREEEVSKYNKSKGYESNNGFSGGVSDDDIKSLGKEHVNSIRESKI